MSDYFASYSDLFAHRLMLGDVSRTEAFRDAINEVVRPGCSVLDVGTGTGILALFAASAGASKVYAVDESSILEIARELASINGLGESIDFRRTMAEELTLPEQVDVLISEWMGYFALAEAMFESVIVARERHLKPRGAGTMMPSRVDLFVAPVDAPELYRAEGPGLWTRSLYGFDFSLLADIELSFLETVAAHIDPGSYLAAPIQAHTIDCSTAEVSEFYFESKMEFTVEREGAINGFAGHFDAQLSPSVLLSTASSAQLTHWKQSYFPVAQFEVEAGDRVVVEFGARPPPAKDRLPSYTLRYEHFCGTTRMSAETFSYRATFAAL